MCIIISWHDTHLPLSNSVSYPESHSMYSNQYLYFFLISWMGRPHDLLRLWTGHSPWFKLTNVWSIYFFFFCVHDIAEELVLDTNVYEQLSEDKDISCALSVIDTDTDKEVDIIQINSTQWTDFTQSWPSAHIIHRIRGVSMGWDKMRYPILLRILHTVFSLSLPWNYATVGARDKQQNLDTFHVGCSPMPDATRQDMYFFSSIIVQMEHKQRDTLKH